MTIKAATAAPQFSPSALARSMIAGTDNPADCFERRYIEILNESRGVADNGMDHAPLSAFAKRTPLEVGTPTAGGDLTYTALQADGYIAALQAESTVLSAGARVVNLDRNTTAIPVGASPLTVYWAPDESTPIPASTMSFGLKTAIRHVLYAMVPVSRQLLLTSTVDEYVANEARNAIAAQLDLVAIQGSGTVGQPTGILNVSGTNTISGTSLNYAALVGGMVAVAGANAVARPAFITTPGIAGLLKTRPGATASVPIWEGPVARGAIDQQLSFGTNNVPGSNLIHGDFRELLIAQWSDGLQLDIDIYSQFQLGIVTFRFAVSVDVQVRAPGAFAIATGVT
jgi:HK97 family phage major capsid protein